MSAGRAPYGLVGEFRTPAEAVEVARELREAGFLRWDIYAPSPLEEIEHAVPTRRGVVVTLVMFAAAIVGACWGYFIQYWDAVLAFPINVGGRPLNSWPGFVPSAWEICALFTVYFGFFAFLATTGLPRFHHPIFEVPRFDRASQDRFFVAVEATDERYDATQVRAIFARHGLVEATEIAS